MSDAQQKPFLIAHRGAPLEAPENTLLSFQRALARDVDGIELDVRLTRDGVPVVVHDESLDRLAGISTSVSDMSQSELSEIDVGSHLDPAFSDCRVPRLDEVLDLLAEHDIQLLIEIKGQRRTHDAAARAVLETIAHHSFARPPIVSTSDVAVIAALAKRDGNAKLAFIVRQPLFSFFGTALFAKLYGIAGVHVRKRCLTQSLVKRCASRRLHLFAWDLHTADDIKDALTLGVDGIIADDLVMARRVIEAYTSR